MAIKPEDRKRLEEMGEARVRLTYQSSGFSADFQIVAREWLAELEEARLERTEKLQAEQTRLARIAACGSIGAIVAAILGAIITIVVQNYEVAQNVKIKGELGEYISRGYDIARYFPNDKPKEDKWTMEVETFLRANLDKSFVTRFDNADSIQGAPSYNGGMQGKLDQLKELKSELP
jgi:hypothetical protein